LGLGFTLCHRSIEDASTKSLTFPPWVSGAATLADGEADQPRNLFLLQTFLLSGFVFLLCPRRKLTMCRSAEDGHDYGCEV